MLLHSSVSNPEYMIIHPSGIVTALIVYCMEAVMTDISGTRFKRLQYLSI